MDVYGYPITNRARELIREVFVVDWNPLGVSPSRIEAVGLGEEQLLNSAKPDAAENRRVQLINIGK